MSRSGKYFYLDECEDAIIRASVAIAVYEYVKAHPQTQPVDLAHRSGTVIENIHCATRMLQLYISEQPQDPMIQKFQDDLIALQLNWNKISDNIIY